MPKTTPLFPAKSIRLLAPLALLIGASCADPFSPSAVVYPSCLNPAPLNGTYVAEAPDLYFGVREGLDVAAEVNRLSQRYGFAPRAVLTNISVFSIRNPDPRVVAKLRCENSVLWAEFDGVMVLN